MRFEADEKKRIAELYKARYEKEVNESAEKKFLKENYPKEYAEKYPTKKQQQIKKIKEFSKKKFRKIVSSLDSKPAEKSRNIGLVQARQNVNIPRDRTRYAAIDDDAVPQQNYVHSYVKRSMILDDPREAAEKNLLLKRPQGIWNTQTTRNIWLEENSQPKKKSIFEK